MAREQSVIDTFVTLADTLAGDYDIIDFLHALVERCEEVLVVDAGGVMLDDGDGALRLVSATSDKMERYEQTELRHGEGPCIDAYRTVDQVVAHDLNLARDRWPRVADVALSLGMQSVYAFPLRLRDDCIGALNLYREKVGPFDEEDVRLAQAFADVAAIGILQARAVSNAEARAQHLQHALTSRITIEQAKGVVMANTGLNSQQAFDMLRAHSRKNRVKLNEVARGVIESQAANPS